MPESPAVTLPNTNSATPQQPLPFSRKVGRPATRRLSNVQLLPEAWDVYSLSLGRRAHSGGAAEGQPPRRSKVAEVQPRICSAACCARCTPAVKDTDHRPRKIKLIPTK